MPVSGNCQIFAIRFQLLRPNFQCLVEFTCSNLNPKVVNQVPKIGTQLPADSGIHVLFSQSFSNRYYFCYSVPMGRHWLVLVIRFCFVSVTSYINRSQYGREKSNKSVKDGYRTFAERYSMVYRSRI